MIREIPKAFEYTCDLCEVAHLQENASGHYTNSRPARWATLILQRDDIDIQGMPCAKADMSGLFCPECAEKLVTVINGLQLGRKL